MQHGRTTDVTVARGPEKGEKLATLIGYHRLALATWRYSTGII
jgi:hypothetical protein